MTNYSLPFRSIAGDRKIGSATWRFLFQSFFNNGIFPNPSENLQVFENGNMTTIVKKGTAFINGVFMYESDDFIIQHDIADGILNRIDCIVVRLDNNARTISSQLKKGALASNPVAPTLQRDAEAFELALAYIYIGRGTTQITQANITDTRLNSNLCGIVYGAVSQIDTTTLFNQYQSWLEQQKLLYETDMATWIANQQAEWELWRASEQTTIESWIAEQQQEFLEWTDTKDVEYESWLLAKRAEFDVWFAELQVMLDGDVAANLASRIIEIEKVVFNGTGFHIMKDASDNIFANFNLNFYVDEDENVFYVGSDDSTANATVTFENGEITIWKVS